jgi:hypothetical protein
MRILLSRGRPLLAIAVALALASCASPRGAAGPQASCADFSFPVYFSLGSDQLTTSALEVIADSASRAKSCRVVSLSLAYVAGPGSADLAARRSTAITKALAANGVTSPPAELTGSGQRASFPLLGRRFEVVVHLAPPAG